MRCEADHKDGMVCQTVLVNGECPKASDHLPDPNFYAADIRRELTMRISVSFFDKNGVMAWDAKEFRSEAILLPIPEGAKQMEIITLPDEGKSNVINLRP